MGQFLSTLSLRRATFNVCVHHTAKNISIHALLAESDPGKIRIFDDILNFYPRSPCGERLRQHSEPDSGRMNFYPRSPCGERLSVIELIECGLVFLSTLSLRRATVCAVAQSPASRFLSTLSLRRATEREEKLQADTTNFYPRSPCGERQRLWTILYSCPGNFYPRSPCGERPMQVIIVVMHALISIHALLAESDSIQTLILLMERLISIHALLAESDGLTARANAQHRKFLSTLSLRRATQAANDTNNTARISIHALLAESDSTIKKRDGPASYFYPRSPCGERHQYRKFEKQGKRISIHALLAESDNYGTLLRCLLKRFLSTLSLRRATKQFLSTW